MERKIIVQGVGKASTKPDLIVINMTVLTTKMEYAEAVAEGARKTEAVRAALLPLGFAKEDVKTGNYNISTRYEGEHDEHGNFRQRFAGYDCVHTLNLEFPMDSERLTAVISALAESSAAPEFHIRFTVKNTETVLNNVLRDATARAKERAAVLCEAADVRLGQLLSIDYSWGGAQLYSRTECAPMLRMAKAGNAMADMDIVPEDIQTEETVTFVWEIG